ncbi:hypothetical protein RJ639_040819 [Escallonia herrerae]|uniref:RNase H type-1 domain-containing protein n=1 Tax=Escallonia herrerae TaxID=1293975 RepID=A0AA88WG01_9ASTE|nr:hypothetical protein RJ639_040819 [Escallonia herrerae]
MDTPLYGFSNHPVVAEGIIALPVAIGTPPAQTNFMLDFVVVKVPSTYNAILGRPALNQLQAVVSTYHLKMKFPTEHGIGEVKGDQTTARQCYVTSCRSKNKEALIIEDLWEDTKMQRGEPVEDLVSIEVYPGEENKTVRIGSNLKEDTKLELVNLLRIYADIFAWTAVDMPGIDPEIITHPWNLYVDGSSALGSSGAGLILISPEGFTIEYALRFGFQASNNEAEYEALLAGIRLAHALKVDSLSVHSDSQLVVNHVLGDYEARDERMAQYVNLVKTSAVKFQNFTIRQIPRDQNTQADTLSRLASAEETDVRRPIYLEFLKDRSISSQTEVETIEQEPCWMDMIVTYLSTGELPSERHEARNLRVKAARYALVEGTLYKKSFSLPYLRCLRPSESIYALQEVHEGICGQHLGGRTLAHKILRQGYYWPTMQRDAIEFTRRCDKCQKFAPISHTPVVPLTSIVSPIPFAIWGMDLLGPFPMASSQRRFVIVAIDYFTKWTEAESLAENMNRSILQGLKKKLDEAKGAWVDELPNVLWAYRTTPHSVTGETPFLLCYGTEAMLPVKIKVPTIRALHFHEVNNEAGLRANLDLLDETRTQAHERSVVIKHRVARYYNQRVRSKQFQEGDLVLHKLEVSDPKAATRKLSPNWEGPYRVIKVLKSGAYALGTLSWEPIPRTWNAENLSKYYQ